MEPLQDPRPGGTSLDQALFRPQLTSAVPPCAACAAGVDVRGWIALIAQRRKLGLSDAQALLAAWHRLTAVNPFPATLGRICPHPCEAECNRGDHGGSVAINAIERFLGDWALAEGCQLRPPIAGPQPESIGVIGAGPAGLSFAYQMARRGYRVTVYEKQAKAGGMLYYGIPEYRLPERVLDAEIARLQALTIDLRLNCPVGHGLPLEQVRAAHAILFLGIGAGRGLKLGIPDEDGAGCYSGAEYLGCLNRGQAISFGGPVVVVGGGNTAMDAARSARRTGVAVVVLYRRTRAEIPAIASEVDHALAEGVRILFLTAPVAVLRDTGLVRGIRVQRMQLGEPDGSGRRSPIPIPGSTYDLPCRAVISAVSQQTDWEGLDDLRDGMNRATSPLARPLADDVCVGGDLLGPGIAGAAIAQGRLAAEAAHARLRGLAIPEVKPIGSDVIDIKPDHYDAIARAQIPATPVALRLAHPDTEVHETMGADVFFAEASRCYSCGSCFGCEQCFMFCNPGGYTRRRRPQPGAYFELDLTACEGCRKCVELCPCGFLTLSSIDNKAATHGFEKD